MKQKFISSLVLFIFTLMCVGAYMLIRERKLNMVHAVHYAESNTKNNNTKETENKVTENKENTSKKEEEKDKEEEKPSGNKVINNDVLTPAPSISGKVENVVANNQVTPTPGLEVIRDNTPTPSPSPEVNPPEEDLPVTPVTSEYIINEANYQNISDLNNYDVITVKGDFKKNDIITLASSSMVDTLNIETTSLVKVNSEVDTLNVKSDNANLVINRNVNSVTVSANDSIITGSGYINNLMVNGEGTKAFINAAKVETAEGIKDLIVSKEENTNITSISIINNSSISFTLNKATKITINDIKLKSLNEDVNIYNIYSDDNLTYTIVTSPLKEIDYDLYVTLPTGNLVSENFAYQALAPSVTGVNTRRISSTKASLELFGLDQDSTLYYLVLDTSTWSRCASDEACIISEGHEVPVTKGYNNIEIDDLKAGQAYRIHYLLKGENVSKIYGSYDINNAVSTEDVFYIKRAAESSEAIFSFELNKAPEENLTLDNFSLISENQKNLSLNDAELLVSEDKLSYVIKVKDNYAHTANQYNITIDIDGTKISKSFTSHFAYPLISKQKVVRVNDNLVSFTFNSDEAGTVYYGRFDATNTIYNGRHSTPLAQNVMEAIESGSDKIGLLDINSSELHAGANDINIDITNYPLSSETRIWVLFVDNDGNYKTGFVDYYGPIPEAGFDFDNPSGSTLAITGIEVNNPFIKLTFNEEFKNVTAKDISFAIVSGEEARLLNRYSLTTTKDNLQMFINIDNPHYYFPKGTYDIVIGLYDKDNKWVKLKQEFTIS